MFLPLRVINSYVSGLVLGVSFFTFGGRFFYFWALVFLRLGVSFLTFGALLFLRLQVSRLTLMGW